jgi:hypothetical protein
MSVHCICLPQLRDLHIHSFLVSIAFYSGGEIYTKSYQANLILIRTGQLCKSLRYMEPKWNLITFLMNGPWYTKLGHDVK